MTTRRLAAILAADVVGFSSMMEKDEEGTASRIRTMRREVVEPTLSAHEGRLVKATGDGFLAEFASPVQAVRCALAIQDKIAGQPENVGMKLRIGINLGDIIIEDDGDVFGDGVNVAARLEQMANPGGVLISGKIYEEIEGKIDRVFESQGEQEVKNLARPVRIYALAGAKSPKTEPKLLPLPDKPSIAVLPFTNMSGDPEQEYFSDGLVEDIITALSQVRGLFVIARNSSFTYKGKPVDLRQIGTELGVRYVLEGSVRKGGNRLRITGQLIDAASGAHIWAEKYDGALADVFDLQDAITMNVVAAIEPALLSNEQARSRSKPTESMTAYDCYLQALAASHLYAKREMDSALELLARAVAFDPSYAAAYALSANCRGRRLFQGWADDPEAEVAVGTQEARLALEKDADDPEVLSRCAWALIHFGADIAECSSLASRAIRLNPNSVQIMGYGGWVATYKGDYATALECFTKAVRLSPRDPLLGNYTCGLAACHFFQRHFEDAASFAQEAVARTPNFSPAYSFLASAYVQLGKHAQASATVEQLLRRFPNASVSRRSRGFVNNPDLPLLTEALRKRAA